jgi:hypothetical protein
VALNASQGFWLEWARELRRQAGDTRLPLDLRARLREWARRAAARAALDRSVTETERAAAAEPITPAAPLDGPTHAVRRDGPREPGLSRILFVMLHPGFIRYYEGALLGLAAAGHDVHLAFEDGREKLGNSMLAARLEAASPRITCGHTPARSENVRDFLARKDRGALRGGGTRLPAAGRRDEVWDSAATTVRVALDYLRYFEPAFARAGKLRDRAEKRLPRVYVAPIRAVAALGTGARRLLAGALGAFERAIPVSAALETFIREQRPDLLLVTPLIELGSQQVDYVKCARRLGLRSALCVASWDNLTSKGLIRVVPDHVVVWNEAQKSEAVTLHGVPPEAVIVTGAQVFDKWFEARPSRTRQEFCRAVGLDPDRPFVLYVGSSVFVAPDEVPFTERWVAHLRNSADPLLASAGILVRPHPANARQWLAFNAARPGVAVWPPVDSDPNGPDVHRDYFESLYYSAAVVGVNTSAQLEAGIVGRPVFTIRSPEFEHSQGGTLHFQHLVSPDSGVVQSAATLDEHLTQLGAVLRGDVDATEANRRFVRSFIRPHGEQEPAGPVFVRSIASLAAMPRPAPQQPTAAAALARPLAYGAARVARALAEDRPLWVHVLRPLVTLTVRGAAVVYWARTDGRERLHHALKRARRQAQRARHESGRAIERQWRRARKRARQVRAAASGVVRRSL